jgi:Ca2+/Na+ antiporter
LTAIVSPLTIDRAEVGMDVLIMIGVAAFLAAWITVAKNVNRRMGLVFLAAYIGYCVMRYL